VFGTFERQILPAVSWSARRAYLVTIVDRIGSILKSQYGTAYTAPGLADAFRETLKRIGERDAIVMLSTMSRAFP
jgi:hypothetical protein